MLVAKAQKKCKQCSEVCANENELQKHIRRVHGLPRPHECNICGFKAEFKWKLNLHLVKHSNPRPFQCSKCPDTFTASSNLKKHVKVVHFGLRECSCDECPKRFATAAELKSHKQSKHVLIKPFPCTICGSRYGNKGGLDLHVKIKHETKGYQCYFCFRQFARYSDSELHLYTHTKEKHLKCHLDIEGKPCSFTSSTKHPLKCHLRVVHEGHQLQCSLCSYNATTRKTLFAHITKMHSQKRPEKCTECLLTFASSEEMRGHMRRCHSTAEKVKCLQCPKSFKTKSSLRVHVNYVHGLQTFECDKCNFKTTTSLRLRNHSIIHEKNRERKFVCEICKKGFFTHRDYKKHLKIHKEDRKKWTCYFCPNVYKDMSGFYAHLRFHTKEKLVGGAEKKCKKCSVVCANKSKLHQHVLREHCLKPYECTICGFKMDYNYQLKYHMATKHSTLRPFECSICPATFNLVRSLQSHIQVVHFGVKDYGCDKCTKMFRTAIQLKYHVRAVHCLIKPFPCTICDNRYRTKTGLELHRMSAHQPKGYSCYFCSREFSTLKGCHEHLATHTMERPFKCHLNVDKKGKIMPCRYASSEKRQVKRHIQAVHEGYRIQCSLCSHKTTTKSSLFQHIRRMHTRERHIKCVKCEKRFLYLVELRNHECEPIDNLLKFRQLKKPIFPCLICRTTRVIFQTKNTLRIHVEECHSEQSFRCYFCTRHFNHKEMFEGHVRREHTMEKVIRCNICCLEFLTDMSLRRHRQADKHRASVEGNRRRNKN